MNEERRRPIDRSQREKEQVLNDDQLIALRSLENFGWQLRFVRQPLFQDPVPVLYDADTGAYAVLRDDGTIDTDHGLDIRH